LFVALQDGGTNEDALEEQNKNDNPKTDATAALTKKNCYLSSGTSGCHNAGEQNYQMIESIFKKYTDKKKDEKSQHMEYNEHCLTLEEMHADDDCALRQMQHEMMMNLIMHLSNKCSL
jgi:hypothetical protein